MWKNKLQRKALLVGLAAGFIGSVFLPAKVNPALFIAKLRGGAE